MKKLLLSSLRLRIALVVAALCSLGTGSAWADTAGFTLGSTSTVPLASGETKTTTIAGSSETWNVVINGTWSSSTMQGSVPNKSWQMGANGSAITSATFSTSGIPGTISSIVVNCSSYKAKAKVNCTVGGSNFGTQGQSTPSWTTVGDVTFSGSGSGNIVVTLDNSADGARAVYIRSITVTYVTITGDPSITVMPKTRTVSYDTEDGTLGVTLNKIDTDLGTEVVFYASDGTTPASYDWFTANINGDGNVEYALDENTDVVNSRTAYFKVYGLDEDEGEDVYSDLISITQSKYTLDYATLPFAYDGGKADLPTGMTHSGLDTDYASSPYLKFNTQDDVLDLKVKGAMLNKLEFDIKGNSMSGTYAFKVQWSANGTDYTDLASYTLISASTETKTIDISSCTGLRYIKWVYTKKDAGNVALGNIKVIPQTESVTVSSAGFATYVSSNPLDFTGKDIKAYIAKTKGNGSGVTFTQVNRVPANTGVLLYYDGGTTEDINKLRDFSTDDVTGNKFVKGTGSGVLTDDGTNYNYILNNIDDNIGFYKAAGQTVATNRAYISILKTEGTLGAKGFFTIDFDEFDGVKRIQDSSAKIQDAKIFNLAGQRMSKMQRGINIVNGKKVVIK